MAHCIITGGSRGIGRATAMMLAAAGWKITLNYRERDIEARAAADEICATGGKAEIFRADITDPEAVAAMVKEAEALFGPVGALVCNAGIMHNQFTAMTAPADWRKVQNVNLDGAFYATKAVIRSMMRQRRGRIVYVSSDAALLGDLMRAAYSASKAGLLGLMRSVARETAPSGITVNAVTPGIIATDMTADTPENRRQRQLDAIPMKRFGKPAEVASAIRFLLSDDASFITGQTLSVNGGLCM